MKVCSDCKIKKPFTEFYKSSRHKGEYQYSCKKCRQKYNNTYTKKERNKWGSGVYGIFEDGKCLYIGESSTLYRRLIQHKTGVNNPKHYKFHTNLYKALGTHNHLIFGVIEECENHKEREQHFIDIYKPIYNNR